MDQILPRILIFKCVLGTFTEQIETTFAYITHTIYAHQKYTRLLISDLFMRRKSDSKGGTIELEYPSTESSDDLDFNGDVGYYDGSW